VRTLDGPGRYYGSPVRPVWLGRYLASFYILLHRRR